MTTRRHGVVIVQGHGDRPVRGAMLAEFANPVVDLLRTAGNDVILDFDGDAPVPAGRMEVRRPAGRSADDDDHHVFELREGFWTDAFPPPGAGRVTRWALAGLGSQIDGIRTGWWRNPTAAPSEDERGAPADAQPMLRVVRRISPEGPRWLRWSYRFTLLLLTALLLLLSALTFLLLRPLEWFFTALSSTPGVRLFGFTARIANAVAELNPFVSSTLGATERFVTDGTWAVNVRGRVERTLLAFLDDELDDITIVAYSAGAGVVYDVLLEGRALSRRVREIASAGDQPTPVRLVTIGSGVYHMWSFARMDAVAEVERRRLFTGRIDPAISGADAPARPFPFWTDLFARFDFVAAGPIRPEIAARSGLREGEHYRSHRVINYDDISDDHFGYFNNRELAVPRVIAALFGSDRWADEGPSAAASAGGFTYIDPRRRAISAFWLDIAKLLPFIVLVVHAALLQAARWYREFCTAFSDAIVPGWAEGLWARIAGEIGVQPISLARIASEVGVRPQFIVVGAVLFVFFLAFGRALHGWWRPMVDDGKPLQLRRGIVALARVPTALAASVRQNAPGYVFLLAVLVALGAAGLWYYVPAEVRAGAFTLESGPHRFNAEIVGSTVSEVALRGPAKDVAHPGTLGLAWDGGYGQVGEVLREYDDRIVRRFTPLVSDDPAAPVAPPLGPARIDTGALPGDPLIAHGLAFVDVAYQGPLGPQRAWIAGAGSTWAIVVHGRGATRAEGLRILPTLVDLGMTAMVITYRNDRESIHDPDGEYEYGASEWRDLEAAVDHALAQGAVDVVIYGYSMGGAISVSFLERSDRASHVRAVVLDAPMLDFAPTVELGLSGALPEVLVPRLRVMTGIRLTIDWAELNYLDEDVARLQAPILLFHGDADDVVPVETSRRLASLRADIVTYVEVPRAGHTREWNVDPAAYEARVREFLGAQLARQVR